MARWERAKSRKITGDLPGPGRIQPEAGFEEVIDHFGSDPIMRLGLIAKYASDLSLKCWELPRNDRLRRTQLLAEFRSVVAQFFKVRAAMLERRSEETSITVRQRAHGS
jgi:hypothetical protein